MFKAKRDRIKGQSFNRMIPNILTMLALCAGLTALRFGLEEKWEAAVISIVIAGVLDTLDGRVARLLRGTSKFGAELDSLSDFVGFGVAPALLLFLWTMKDGGPMGWVLVLLFSVCCALRLARFNTNIDGSDLPPWATNYFVGVPAPAGGGLVLLPLIISFQLDSDFVRQPFLVGIVIVIVSFLLISKLPTYSFKKFRVPHRFVLLTMLSVGIIAALAVSAPWLTLTILLTLYIVSLLFSPRSFSKLERQEVEESKVREDV